MPIWLRSAHSSKSSLNKPSSVVSRLIPREFIDNLLAQINIVETIEQHVSLKKAGNNFVARCPFHDEKTPSFSVSPDKQIYYCFGCGKGGNAISFVMDFEHLSFPETIELLANQAGLTVPRIQVQAQNQSTSQSQAKQQLDDYSLLEQVNRFYRQQLRTHPEAQLAIDYLKNRGLDGAIAKKFQLGFAPPGWHQLEKKFREPQQQKTLINLGLLIESEKNPGQRYDRYRNRITFPIRNYRGRIVGFGGRVVSADAQPKYLNSPESALFKKNRELYGLYETLQNHRKPEKIIVVEGYMDVVALAQFGIDYAVATLGTATTQAHIQLLARYSKQLIFSFDGDTAGRAAAWRALTHCLGTNLDGLHIQFLFLPDGEDPDSLIRKIGLSGFEQNLAEATDLADYCFEHLQQTHNISSMHGRSALLKSSHSLFAHIPNSAFREMMLNRLAQVVRIDVHRLTQMLKTGVKNDPIATVSQPTRLPIQQLAFALLVQNPQIATEAEIRPLRAKLVTAGHLRLAELIELTEKTPQINTAHLLEYWRDNESFPKISQLANFKHHVPETGIKSEIHALLMRLIKQHAEQQIQQLMQNISRPDISPEVRRQLQQELQSMIETTKR